MARRLLLVLAFLSTTAIRAQIVPNSTGGRTGIGGAGHPIAMHFAQLAVETWRAYLVASTEDHLRFMDDREALRIYELLLSGTTIIVEDRLFVEQDRHSEGFRKIRQEEYEALRGIRSPRPFDVFEASGVTLALENTIYVSWSHWDMTKANLENRLRLVFHEILRLAFVNETPAAPETSAFLKWLKTRPDIREKLLRLADGTPAASEEDKKKASPPVTLIPRARDEGVDWNHCRMKPELLTQLQKYSCEILRPLLDAPVENLDFTLFAPNGSFVADLRSLDEVRNDFIRQETERARLLPKPLVVVRPPIGHIGSPITLDRRIVGNRVIVELPVILADENLCEQSPSGALIYSTCPAGQLFVERQSDLPSERFAITNFCEGWLFSKQGPQRYWRYGGGELRELPHDELIPKLSR